MDWRAPGGQLVVTSGVTVIFEACMGHQLEYLKIVRQTTMQPYTWIIGDIFARRGIAGFWDGFVPWGLLQAVLKGAVFGFAHASIRRLAPLDSPHLADTVAGAGAGGVQGLVLSPALLLKTRVMTDPGVVPSSPWAAIVHSCRAGVAVVSKEGVASLMKGSGTFAAKRVGDWGSRYAFTNFFEDVLVRRRPLTYPDRILASTLGGIASATCTLPIDVMVANIQSASAAGKQVSLFGSFIDKFKAGGFDAVAGFATRGFVPRCAHVTLTTVVVKTGTAYVQDLLDPPRSLVVAGP